MDNKELTWQEFAALFTALRVGSYAIVEEDNAINEINEINEINQPEGTSEEGKKE